MKNVTISLRKNLLRLGSALAVALVLFACKKTGSGETINIPAAHLMAFNLAPDKPAIGITLSGNLVTQAPLNYTSYTGGYLNIYPGSRSINSFDYTNRDSLAANSFTFDSSRYYSLFVVGRAGAYSNVVALDNYDSLSSTNGLAYVRYINAIPDNNAPTVTITSNGSNVINASAPYKSVSGFIAVTPGEISISATNEGSVNTTRKITVEKQKVYTILLSGTPGSPDADRAVQVKFIQNGSL